MRLQVLTSPHKVLTVTEFASMGGKASSAKLSDKQRAKRASMAAKARWSKRKKKK